MTSRAQMQLVRGRSHSENLTFSASLQLRSYNQEHRNIDPLSLQL